MIEAIAFDSSTSPLAMRTDSFDLVPKGEVRRLNDTIDLTVEAIGGLAEKLETDVRGRFGDEIHPAMAQRHRDEMKIVEALRGVIKRIERDRA